MERSSEALRFLKEASKSEEDYLSKLARFEKGEPLAYIIGNVPFLDTTIHVTPDVLIPRPETEILADMVEGGEGKVLFDICTGSGALAISLKKRFPSLSVYATDISSKALAVARQNAAANGVDVQFFSGDLLEPLKGLRADLVVCNPPYIRDQELDELPASVRDFEPHLALFGGEDGLTFYRRMHASLPSVLRPGAKIYFEIGQKMGDALLDLYREPMWHGLVKRDWAGHERFFLLEYQP